MLAGMTKNASLCMLALLTLRSAATDPHERIPVQPLAPRELFGHENAYLLQNRVVEAAIFPSLGRMGFFNFRGEPGAFRFDTNLAEWAAANPSTAAGADWRNYGGDWLWPVSQTHWPAYFGAHWPPPWIIDGPAWKANGWISQDGAESVALEMEVGAPLHIVVRRVFTLPPNAAALTIRQRIERTAPSDVPVTLWNISQIEGAQRVALAVETNSAFVDGYRVLDFAPPNPEVLSREGPSVLVVDTARAGEIKIGSDSPRAWIAAQRGDLLIFERAVGRPDAAAFPDGGCRVELYANSGLGYAEIETLSEERVLAPGEAIENVLTISLHRVPADMPDAEFAARARAVAGESAARPVME
jgi:hypothetical protein